VLQVRNLPPRIATFLIWMIGGQIATWTCYICPHKLIKCSSSQIPSKIFDQHRQLMDSCMVPWKFASFGVRSTQKKNRFIKYGYHSLPDRAESEIDYFRRDEMGFHFQQGKATTGWDGWLLLKHVITIGFEIGSGDDLKASLGSRLPGPLIHKQRQSRPC